MHALLSADSLLGILSIAYCVCVVVALQNQGAYGACVGFAVTAAAEAAINVHLGQNWNRLSLSEQSLSFCRCEQHNQVVCELHSYRLLCCFQAGPLLHNHCT
jgi:hypothetical protein